MTTRPTRRSRRACRGLVSLLEQRYGDGTIYFQAPQDERWFQIALRDGLVSEEGCLTASGRAFLGASGGLQDTVQ